MLSLAMPRVSSAEPKSNLCFEHDLFQKNRLPLRIHVRGKLFHGHALADQSASPKRESIKAAKASTTSVASRPVAATVIDVPGAAASIIRPMIEVPPTLSLQRVTRTSASNFSTVCTNLADARACRPFLLQMTKPRETAPLGALPASGMPAL